MMKALSDLISHLVDRQKVLMAGDEMDKYAASIIEKEVKALRLEYRKTIDSMNFKLVAETYSSELMNIGDVSLSKTQLENTTIFQPLAELCAEEVEELSKILVKELDANDKAPILLIPYDVRVIKIKGIIPEE